MAGNGIERRQSIRLEVPCPWVMRDPQGQMVAKGRSINVGNGGMFLPMRVESLPPPQTPVTISFAVPRTTPNTYMLEDFSAQARILRHQPLVNESMAGVAVQFAKPINLGLEV